MWQNIKNVFHSLVAFLIACWYRFPHHGLTIIGVTGTDGKTTTTHLIYHILKTSGKKASFVSSVHAEIAGKTLDTGFHVTTPDPFMLQKLLRQVVDAGDRFMVIEVTSHALDQNRTLGVHFDYGVITNVTHEHLDYHKKYENYVKTKEKLLIMANTAVINRDDESYVYFSQAVHNKEVTYARKNDASITEKNFPFTTLLPGDYNRYNCLAAIAVCKQIGVSDGDIRSAVENFAGVEGRYEYIKNDCGITIVIDFAHTPHAFAEVLSYTKTETKGKLIHLFGSAALRDKTKRPIMGQNSARYADLIVLTEEDYRTENVNKIIDEIAQGCLIQGAKEFAPTDYQNALNYNSKVFFRIPDRKSAIDFAIKKLAKVNDTVILTGKAHEKSLCRGEVEYPWSEHQAVRDALKGNNPDV